jgi:uncharacterized membrane protein YidH (DUF202 family)
VTGGDPVPDGRPPGAARERTRLAWRRTALAATVVALLFARLAGLRGAAPLGALAVPGWLVALAVARRRIRAARPDPARWELPLLALAVLSIAVFGTALVVLP